MHTRMHASVHNCRSARINMGSKYTPAWMQTSCFPPSYIPLDFMLPVGDTDKSAIVS